MRLIDADAVISFVDAGHLRNPSALSWSDKDVVDMLEARPTIDAVPIVRCKNCKFRDTIDCVMQFYGYDDDENLCLSDDWTRDDGFCYWGERKENV